MVARRVAERLSNQENKIGFLDNKINPADPIAGQFYQQFLDQPDVASFIQGQGIKGMSHRDLLESFIGMEGGKIVPLRFCIEALRLKQAGELPNMPELEWPRNAAKFENRLEHLRFGDVAASATPGEYVALIKLAIHIGKNSPQLVTPRPGKDQAPRA